MRLKDFANAQEAVALGNAMLEALANEFSCESTEAAIKRAVYKQTPCGAWIAFPVDHPLRVELGSIIEGSDAEVTADAVCYVGDDDTFIQQVCEALLHIEAEVERLWREANKGDEEEV